MCTDIVLSTVDLKIRKILKCKNKMYDQFMNLRTVKCDLSTRCKMGRRNERSVQED